MTRILGAVGAGAGVGPIDPRSGYVATKSGQEHLTPAWAWEAGASAVALRYHNVYGPGLANTPLPEAPGLVEVLNCPGHHSFRNATAAGDRAAW